MKPYIKWVLLVVILSVAVHFAAVWAFPFAIMGLVTQKFMDQTGAVPNQVFHSPLPTPDHRVVVMPSPDLLYSMIVYDLAEGPLKIEADVPPDTYWSLAFYSWNTDNYHHVNDLEVRGRLNYLLSTKEQNAVEPVNTMGVISPSRKGVILARILVNDPVRTAQWEMYQRKLTCRVFR
jgi:uncharacterized membrane protein